MKEWAWVRMKSTKEGAWVRPFLYQVMIGTSWGDGKSRVVSEHTDMDDATRLANFFNKVNEHEES
jgi:hypothetical protein